MTEYYVTVRVKTYYRYRVKAGGIEQARENYRKGEVVDEEIGLMEVTNVEKIKQ